MYIITITDKDNINKTNNLKKTINGIYDLIILEIYDKKLGNKSKITKIYEYLKDDKTIKENDEICIVDGFDVLYNKNKEKNLLYEFEKENADIIISTETRFAHHDKSVKGYFDDIGLRYINKYPNSGFIIGYKHAYKQMFKHITDNISRYDNTRSDQKIISMYMKENKDVNIKLDYKNAYCTTINTEYKKEVDNIDSYFMHITNLKKQEQQLKYEKLCKKLIEEF